MHINAKNVGAFALASIAVVPVSAQTSMQDSIQHLSEVEVVSNYRRPSAVSKLPVALCKAPISVATIGEAQLSDMGITSIETATRNMTGIRPNNTYGGFMTFTIHGFNDFVLLNDGIRDERHNLWQSAPNTSLASVERIEVLKGAASVMFGHSALGGVINIVHKKPTKETHVNAEAQIGSWGRYMVKGGASGSICKNLQFRTDFSMSGGDGWRHTGNKNYNGYFALNWDPTEKDNFQFYVSAKDDHYGADTGQPHFSSDIYNTDGSLAWEKGDIPSFISRQTRYADPKDALNDKDITFSLTYNHKFNQNWYINDHASYYYDDLYYYASEGLSYVTSSDPIYSHYYMNGDKKVYIDVDNIKRTGFNFAYNVKLFQNQLELHGKAKTGSIDHSLMFGYNLSVMSAPRYRNGYAADASGAGKNAIISSVDPVLNQGNIDSPWSKLLNVWENNHGFYVGDYLKITDKFSALASLRYDRFNRTYRENKTEGKTIVTPGTDIKTYDNALTYRLSLLYQFNDAVNVYASTSNFFRPTRTYAADNYIYIGSDGKEITPDGSTIFKPITGYQYEIGSHINVGTRFMANISAFYILKNNMVQSLGTYEGKNVSGQVGRADSKGFDIDFTIKPVDGWTINGGYTFTVAKVRDYAKNEYSENTQAGCYLTGAPKHMYYGWMFYDFHKGALKGLKIGAGFNGTSTSYVNAANTMQFDPYAIANAMISYRFSNWRLQFNLNNIFDKTYYTTAVSTTGYVPMEGRNLMFTASFSM